MHRLLSVVVAFAVLLEPGLIHARSESTQITLRELGVLQLAAHDLFRVDREIEEKNLENDMLDLSTVFDHGEDQIAVGGEIRNSENVAVFSVATLYAHEYLEMLEHGTTKETARARMVRHFHSDLTSALRSMIDSRPPRLETGSTTMTENLAFRVIHDALPSSVIVNGAATPILSPSLFRHALADSELDAPGAPMDGVVDSAFHFITFFTPEGLKIVDLHERDHSFAEQFDTDFTFQHFLDESEDGSLDSGEDATRLIYSLIAKGMGNYAASLEAGDENTVIVVPEAGEATSSTEDTPESTVGSRVELENDNHEDVPVPHIERSTRSARGTR